jgi:hypothetical protein
MLASGNVASAAGTSGSASGAGAYSLAGGAASSSVTAVAGSSPSQDKSVDFLQSTQAGYQSSATTTSNVLLGKDQHLQARSDHRHSWGAEDTGNVDQSCLGRRLFLRLSSRCLLSGSSDRFCAPLSSRGLALQLRQKLFYGGGWATTTPIWFPHCVPIAFDALPNGVGRRHLLQARELGHQHTTSRHQYSTTLFKMAYLLGRGLRDLQLLGHALAALRATLRGFLDGAGKLASRLVG